MRRSGVQRPCLGGGVRHVDLAQDCVAVVGKHDACAGGGGSSVAARVRDATRASRHAACSQPGARSAARRSHAPPEASSSILSIDRGPSVVRMMSDTACERSEAQQCHTRQPFAPASAPLRPRGRDAPWRRRCCPSAPCAPCRASCSGLQRRASGPSVNRQRAASQQGHALNTMMGCPPMVILDDGARRVVAHFKRHPLAKTEENTTGERLRFFAPPGSRQAPPRRPPAPVAAADTPQLPGGAARRTLRASPLRRLRPHIAPRRYSANAAAASLRRGSGRARADASPQLPWPPRCRWLTSPAAIAARLCRLRLQRCARALGRR